jgi:hypothetical protein
MILWYFYEKDPLLNVEFPALYNYISSSKRKIVVNIAKDILRHNSEDFNKEFWECKLKPFLINRSENKPKQLDAEEASAIFDLAKVLYFALDDYLDIIEKLPVMKISQHSRIIHDLNRNNELFSKFTASQIGRIILLMLTHYNHDTSWGVYGADELLGKITPSIEQNLLKEIRKKAKQHGLSW